MSKTENLHNVTKKLTMKFSRKGPRQKQNVIQVITKIILLPAKEIIYLSINLFTNYPTHLKKC